MLESTFKILYLALIRLGEIEMKSFGTTLSELRQSLHLSQRALASDLKISQALLSHYENGTREPKLAFVCKLCEYFGVSSDFLLGITEDKNSGKCRPVYINELEQAQQDVDEQLCDYVTDFMSAAAQKAISLISGENSELFVAEKNAEMAQAELRIIRALYELN